jgi:hypothetical protein
MENIFEYLIPLVLILSFFNYRKKKKQRAAEKNADQAVKKSDGLFAKLNKMMEEYQESDLKGAPVEKQKSRTWADGPLEQGPVYKAPEPWEDEDEAFERAESAQIQSIPVAAFSNSRIIEQPVVKPQKPEVQLEKQAVIKPVPPKPKVPAPGFSKMQKTDLRQAIVWSEILAPPKALRDK